MYVAGLIIPVPKDKLDPYRRWAENGAKLFKELGCLEIVESWEDFVPDGKVTDFRLAVAAKPGEKIVFTWQVWPRRDCRKTSASIARRAALRRQAHDPRLLPANLPDGQVALALGPAPRGQHPEPRPDASADSSLNRHLQTSRPRTRR